MGRSASDVFGSGPDGDLYAIDGTFNARDIGGGKTATAARVRTGRLLRSASLDALTPAGIERVRSFNLRTVIDLRSRVEVDLHGHFPTEDVPVRWEHLPSGASPPTADSSGPSNRMQQHPDPMAPMYQEILQQNGPEIARGIRILASPMNLPAIVHCTSGKDRTGLFVLIVQLVLGVTLDDALDHYHQDDATTQRVLADMVSRFPEMGKLPPEKMERMAGTNSRWVTGALSSIGGERAVPEWLQSHGCDSHTQAQLRAAFLD